MPLTTTQITDLLSKAQQFIADTGLDIVRKERHGEDCTELYLKCRYISAVIKIIQDDANDLTASEIDSMLQCAIYKGNLNADYTAISFNSTVPNYIISASAYVQSQLDAMQDQIDNLTFASGTPPRFAIFDTTTTVGNSNYEQVSNHFVPIASNTYDIGSSSRYLRAAYANIVDYSSTIIFKQAGTERFRANNTGGFAIGTTIFTEPGGGSADFVVAGVNGELSKFFKYGNRITFYHDSNVGIWSVGNSGSSVNFGTYNSTSLAILIANAEVAKYDVSGNYIIYNSYADISTQFVVATNGGSTTITDNKSSVVLNPAAGIAGHTLTMPATPINGQEVTISAGSFGITTLTLNANAGQSFATGAAIATLAASGFAKYRYRTSDTTWYRIG